MKALMFFECIDRQEGFWLERKKVETEINHQKSVFSGRNQRKRPEHSQVFDERKQKQYTHSSSVVVAILFSLFVASSTNNCETVI